MFKPFSLLIILIPLFALSASAQTDTSYYDLGRMLVKKDFTQSVTVKAEDLGRFQFSDLADAINVWFYGTYTNSSNVIYSVDGNTVTDVNAYSIFDVEEVTLVQNAAAYINGAPPGAQLILIKLKTKRPGKQGLEAAGQTSMVNLANQGHVPNVSSTHNFYDQYYLSGYKNLDNVSFGLSADYQHDVLPLLTNGTLTKLTPYNNSRFKLNGFLTAKLWQGTTLDFNVNYVPQKDAFDYSYNSTTGNSSAETIGVLQHMGSSALTINSKIAAGLNNKISAAYNHYNFFGDDYATYADNEILAGSNSMETSRAGVQAGNLMLRDNLWYEAKAGVFNVEPALNFSYARLNDVNTTNTFDVTTGSNGLPANYSSSESENTEYYKTYLLTPNVDIYYKNLVNLQAGLVYILNSGSDFAGSAYHYNRAAPFVTASADILGLAGVTNMGLRIFGSFSRQSELFTNDAASLEGITPFVTVLTNTQAEFFAGSTTAASGFYSDQLDPFQQYNAWQAGFDWHLLSNLSLSYNYWKYQSVDAEVIPVPFGANGETTETFYYYTKIATSRAALNYTLSSNQLTWRTGLNVSGSKVQPQNPSAIYPGLLPYLTDGHRLSGGFTNRFNYYTFFAGLDLLYQFGDRGLSLTEDNPYEPTVATNRTSLSLQNLYLGKQFTIHHLKHAELFFNTRNLWQNASSNITDNRRFYGLGLKVDL